MTPTSRGLDLRARIAALEDDNQRLRTALAEAEARAAAGGHIFLLRDALPNADQRLACLHPPVAGRVSVIVPAYNAACFLERAVRSIWTQDVRGSVEILVVDDGSTDGTRAVAARLAAQSPHPMTVLMHPGGANRGVAPSRQLAATHATGEFVALLDADDAFLPDRIEATITALEARPELAAVCSFGRNVNQDGDVVVGHNGTTRAGEWRTGSADLAPPFTFESLWVEDPIANSSLTIRRAALEAVGGFPSLMAHQAEDWLLVLKLSLLAPIPCIERELILYTHHPGAYTHTYHGNGLAQGARLETFYHLAWWMLHSPVHAGHGGRFLRREYPRLVADHQRLLPLLREYYAAGGRPAGGASVLGEHLERLTSELETLRRTVHRTLEENKRLRRLVAGPVAGGLQASEAR